MELRDYLEIGALLLGPVVAVRLTVWLDDRKKRQERKIHIFRTLMATRASIINPDHVQALNMIDVEFFGNKADKAVIDAWKLYFDHLCDKAIPRDQWVTKRLDLFVELLYVMGKRLKFDFDRTQIKNGIYSPVGHGEIEDEQTIIRKGLAELFKGRPLPVTTIPPQVPEEIQKEWDTVRKGLASLFRNEEIKKITLETETKNQS